jgi:hypothetical protein
MTYNERLRDPRWQQLRLAVMNRDHWACRHCGNTATTLNVHHTVYAKEPWEVDSDSLVTLCEPCHEEVTRLGWVAAEEASPLAVARAKRGVEVIEKGTLDPYRFARGHLRDLEEEKASLLAMPFTKRASRRLFWELVRPRAHSLGMDA